MKIKPVHWLIAIVPFVVGVALMWVGIMMNGGLTAAAIGAFITTVGVAAFALFISFVIPERYGEIIRHPMISAAIVFVTLGALTALAMFTAPR